MDMWTQLATMVTIGTYQETTSAEDRKLTQEQRAQN